MTADRRLQIGGWAALLVAALAPLQVIALFLEASAPDPFATLPYLLVEVARVSVLLVAVLGLDRLYRPIAPDAARTASTVGVLGAVVGIVADLTLIVGVALEPMTTIALLGANVLVGGWFLLGGGILMREGGGLLRVGWTAELGGVGVIVTALAIAAGFGGPVGTGRSWIDWFHLLSLFVVIYLVRVWSYVVRGRLPGPGIL